MSYIDLGEVVKGFTGAAQAVGALSDLNRKLTYGDREYQAELKAKETQAAMGELGLQKAKEEEERKNMDNLLAESRARTKRFDEAANNAGQFKTPLPTESIKQGMMITASNPRLLAGVKKGITDRNWSDVEEFNTIASDNFSRAGKILADGKVNPDEYPDVIAGYLSTRKYNDHNFKLSADQIEVALDGVYQIDSNGNRVAQLETMSPFQLAQGMQYQARAASAIRNEAVRQYGTDNYSKFSKETQKGIDTIQQFQALTKQLPAHLQDQVNSLYQFGTIDHIEKNGIPAVEKLVTEYNNTANFGAMQTLVLNQLVPNGKKSITVAQQLQNTKDPSKKIALLEQATASAFSSPKGQELVKQYGFTQDQILEKLSAPSVKRAEQETKLLKPFEQRADIAEKNAKTASLNRKGTDELSKKDLSGYYNNYRKLIAANEKLDAGTKYMPLSPEQKATYEQNKKQANDFANVLAAHGYPGFTQTKQAIPTPSSKDFTSPFESKSSWTNFFK